MNCTCADIRKSNAPWENAHCFVVVTGASRGFGRCFCLELAKNLTSGFDHAASLTMLILDRRVSDLEKTKNMIIASKSEDSETVLTVLLPEDGVDLGSIDESSGELALRPIFDKLHGLEKVQDERCLQWNLLVHNAGTLGDIEQRADERLSIAEKVVYYKVNLFSTMILTGLFLHRFAPHSKPHAPVTVVNISSLASLKPFPRMSDYCVGKAARQMFLSCLAVDRPSVAVFNYDPGPLDTDMFTEVTEHHGDVKHRDAMQKLKNTGQLVDPVDSAKVCVSWLRRVRPCSNSDSQSVSAPQTLVCNVHEKAYEHLCRGVQLDYYDAVGSRKPSL